MFTVRQTVTHLLSFLDAEQRTIPAARTEDDPIPACLTAIHGGLSELGTLGPLWQVRARKSATIYAPTTFTIPTLTQGGTSFTLTAPTWQSWMLGCSIKIGDRWNEIIGRDENTVLLLNPELTTYGTNVSATVWCDCIQLPDNVLQVLGPVAIADGYELIAAKNLSDIHQAVYDYWRTEDYGFGSFTTNARRRTADSPGPRLYWHDTQYTGSTAPAVSRLRLGPMPISLCVLNYRARMSTPTFTQSDVYNAVTDVSADPGVRIPVRDDLIETVFLPIVRQRFTAAAIFRNESVLGEFKRQYEAALEIARKMKPQTASGGCVQPGY